MQDSDLPAFIEQLRSEGYEAYKTAEAVAGKGSQVGVRIVRVGFFPLWELNDPTNARLVADRDFPNIKAKRPPNWEPVEPRLWGGAKGQVRVMPSDVLVRVLPDGRISVTQDDGTAEAFSTEEQLREHLSGRFGHNIAGDLIRRVIKRKAEGQ
jgi:hypothetical protein